MKKYGKKLAKMALATALLVGSASVASGTSVASAASGHQNVGGGVWTWNSIPGVRASSSYYHGSKTHSASASVGTGKIQRDVEYAGETATATAYGIGTTYVNWNIL